MTQQRADQVATDLHLAVGLGNPEARFAQSRHNVGAAVIDLLAQREQVQLRPERGTQSLCATARRESGPLVLAKPSTYMNESGLALRGLLRRYHVELDQLIVIHDELDLPTGVVRVKRGGGTAGHNGLRSIEAHLKSLDFVRVRIGVGKPPRPGAGADYVLRKVTGPDRAVLDEAVERAADAVVTICDKGVDAAMTAWNLR